MRTSPWYRALLTIVGLWFTVAVSEPGGMHSCPMHGGLAGHALHQTHNGSAAAQGDEHSHSTGDHEHEPSKGCTCLGTCCCAGPVAQPVGAIVLPADVVIAAPFATFSAIARPVVRRAHALPFAHGPPRASQV